MKILIGSHGTGKTTLLQEVNKSFPDYYVTDGFSRPVIKIGEILDFSETEKQITINILSTWAYQNYLNHKNVISTRSIVDCIIYTQILNPEISIGEMLTLFNETKNEVEYFFYIPVEFDFVEDENRLNHDLQIKIDKLIKQFIIDYIPKEKVIIIKGSLEERLKMITPYL